MEKIKDIFYEISDIILGLVVLLIILFLFVYQLQDFFSIDLMHPFSQNSTLPSQSTSMPSEIKPENEFAAKVDDETSINPNAAPNQKDTENITSNESATKTENTKVTEGVQIEPAPQAEVHEESTQTDPTASSGVPKSITIHPGSSSEAIANMLYTNNIISSKSEFLNEIKSKNMEKKLKAGTFTIPKGSSLEEVIAIITK